jgi:hypothetical protein
MFIAALLKIAKLWNQPRCPITNEWMTITWCIYTMEYYSAKKNNKIILLAGK